MFVIQFLFIQLITLTMYQQLVMSQPRPGAILRYDGTNWNTWKMRMKALVRSKKLEECFVFPMLPALDEKVRIPAEDKHDEEVPAREKEFQSVLNGEFVEQALMMKPVDWTEYLGTLKAKVVEKRLEAYSLLICSVGDEVLSLFSGRFEDPVVVWCVLEEKFGVHGVLSNHRLWLRFNSLTLETEDNDIGRFCSAIVSASSELRLVGDEPSDAAKLGRLLAGLGSAHNSLVVSLGMMENLTFDTAVRKVKASLRMARSLLVQDVMHVSAIVPKTRSSAKGRGVCYQFRKKGTCSRRDCPFQHEAGKKSSVKCYFCDGAHRIRDCQKFQAYKSSLNSVDDGEAEYEDQGQDFVWSLESGDGDGDGGQARSFDWADLAPVEPNYDQISSCAGLGAKPSGAAVNRKILLKRRRWKFRNFLDTWEWTATWTVILRMSL